MACNMFMPCKVSGFCCDWWRLCCCSGHSYKLYVPFWKLYCLPMSQNSLFLKPNSSLIYFTVHQWQQYLSWEMEQWNGLLE